MGSIELDRVDMVYPDGFEAVRQVDLSVDDGEFRVLLGPSGCGKSTVLRLIAGLEKPTGGVIRLGGRRANELGPRERDVAMAFQEHALYPHMTVAQNLGFPLKMAGARPRVIKARVREIADGLGLTETLDRKPSQLSGGQQQRVALGRSIVRRPRIFLLDEPLSNLDTRLRVESRTAILRLQRRLGTTTVFVTHDQVEAMALADTITVMRNGRIVQSGAPLEMYHRPTDLYVAQFLGSPAMNLFAGSLVRDESHWQLELGTQHVRLDGEPVDRALWSEVEGRTLAVGFRPEALRPSRDGSLVSSVRSTELLGSEVVVHAVVSAPAVAATSSGVAVSSDREAPITAFASSASALGLWAPFAMDLDARSVYLFDLETGRSLDARSETAAQDSSMVRVT